MNKQIIVNDGTKLAYDVFGQGQPMLFIHGVTDCKETYDDQLSYLTNNFKVYRYDLRGHGHSTHPKKQFNLSDHINDALQLIKQLNLNHFILYGGSLGSYIAQGVAIRIPQKVDKLILDVSASHNPASALAETAKKDHLPNELSKRRNYWIKHLTYDPKNIPVIEKSHFQKYVLNPEDEQRALKSITAFDFRDQLSKITCPTLILSGIYDPVNPPKKGSVLHQLIAHNQFFKFSFGHLLRLEDPNKFKGVLLSFLKLNK